MSTIAERIRGLADTVRRGIERFPLTVVFAFALTVCEIIIEYKGYHGVSNEWKFFMSWYPATGMALSLSLSLWLEEHAGKIAYKLAAVLLHIIWLGVSTLLMQNQHILLNAPYKFVIAALIAVLVLSLLVLSFLKDKNDVAFWNFTIRSIGAVVTALVVSGIVCGGLELLFVAIEKLFGAYISSHCYVNIVIVSFCLLAPILCIQAIPNGTLKHDYEPMCLPRLIENAVTKLFTPIAMAYFITLYCYAAKILFTWQLPDGWVSWLVSASMVAMILFLTMVYPYLKKVSLSSSNWNRMAVNIITRRMPVLMLPLLMLMSIGIARRFSDYGITILRLYLAAFNLWCYAVCIVLIIRRKAGIIWIPVSLVLTFALLTLMPVNVSSYVRKNLTSDVTATLQENGWNGASMSDGEYTQFLKRLDPQTAAQLDSRIDYLKRQFSRQTVKEFIGEHVFTGRNTESVFEDEINGKIEIHRYRSILGDITFNLPQGVTRMCMIDDIPADFDKESIDDDILTVHIHINTFHTDTKDWHIPLDYEFRFPLSQLRGMEEEMKPENMGKNDYNHAICYTGRLVEETDEDVPDTVYLYLDTFHVRFDGKEGYFNASGPVFFK
ncbi:MAG: DUF4153 domain-containing protein [Bacteroidaceae bacterium]|nr:DUF4153 domain-containing protein [Bacteroidaceae bacterium]